jgi:hypothetical protein
MVESISVNDAIQVHAKLKIDVFFKMQKVEPCPITKMLVSNDDGATYADVYVSDKGLATIDWKWTGCKRPNLNMCMNDVFKFFFYSKKEPGMNGNGQFHIFCGAGHCPAKDFLHAAASTRDNAAREPSVHAGHNVSGMEIFATMLPHPDRQHETEAAFSAFETLHSAGKISKSVLWDAEKMAAIQMKEAGNIAAWIKKECVLEAKNGDPNFAKPLTPMHLFNVCQLYMDIFAAATASPHIRYPKVAIALAVSVDCMIKNFHSIDFIHMNEEPFVYCANEVLTWFTMDPEKAKYRFDETLTCADNDKADANAASTESGAVAGDTDNTSIRLNLFDDRLEQVIAKNSKLHVAGSECVDRAMAEPNVNGFDTVAGNDCEDFSAAAQATHMGICQMGPPAKVVLQRRNPALLASMNPDMHDSVDTAHVSQEEIVDCEAALLSPIFAQCDARHMDGILVFCIRYTDLVNKQVIEYQNCLGTALGASADKKTRQLGGHAYGKTLYRPSSSTAVKLGAHTTEGKDVDAMKKHSHCQAQLLVVEGTSSVQNMELDNQNCTVPLAVTVPLQEKAEFENNGFKCIGTATNAQDTQVVMEKVVGAAEFLSAIGANPFMQVRSASSRRSIPFSAIHKYGRKALHGDNEKQQNNSFYQKVFITGDKLVFERSHKRQGKQHFGVSFLDFTAKLDHIVFKKAAGGGMSPAEFSELQTYKQGLWREAFPPSVTDLTFNKNLERSMEKVLITAEPIGEHVNDYLKNCWMTFVSEGFATTAERQKLLQNAAMTCSCFNAQMQAQGSPHRMLCKVAMSSVFRILMFDRTILRNEATQRHAIRDAVRRIQEQNAQGNR